MQKKNLSQGNKPKFKLNKKAFTVLLPAEFILISYKSTVIRVQNLLEKVLKDAFFLQLLLNTKSWVL